MSPARRWPPPHRPQGCSFCPWFFLDLRLFLLQTLPSRSHLQDHLEGEELGHSPGCPCGGAEAVAPLPRALHVLPSRDSLGDCSWSSPGPLVPSLRPYPAHGRPLWGQRTPLPLGRWEKGWFISVSLLPPLIPQLSSSWPGGRDGVGMGPQSSAHPSSRSAPWISSLEKWVLPLLGLGRAPAPLLSPSSVQGCAAASPSLLLPAPAPVPV